jgi:predicted DNA-binding ribbon-helix-helix protein
VIDAHCLVRLKEGNLEKTMKTSPAPHHDGHERAPGSRIITSVVVKRSIVLHGHKTSVSLEDQFWDALRDVARRERVTLSELVGKIDHNRSGRNLSSAIRVFILDYFRQPDRDHLNMRSNADAGAARTNALFAHDR